MRGKDQREWQGLVLSNRVRADRIGVFFGVLSCKPPKFGKSASEEQNGGTWGFSFNSSPQKLSSGQAAALIPPDCSEFLSLRSKSNGEEVPVSSDCSRELGISLTVHSVLGTGNYSQTPCSGYSLSVYCPQIHCSFLSCIFL